MARFRPCQYKETNASSNPMITYMKSTPRGITYTETQYGYKLGLLGPYKAPLWP